MGYYNLGISRDSPRMEKRERGAGRINRLFLINEAEKNHHRPHYNSTHRCYITSTMLLAKLLDPVMKMAAKSYKGGVAKELNKMGK